MVSEQTIVLSCTMHQRISNPTASPENPWQGAIPIPFIEEFSHGSHLVAQQRGNFPAGST
jgi:hypothetical protein